jgi:hypothetical protein
MSIKDVENLILSLGDNIPPRNKMVAYKYTPGDAYIHEINVIGYHTVDTTNFQALFDFDNFNHNNYLFKSGFPREDDFFTSHRK